MNQIIIKGKTFHKFISSNEIDLVIKSLSDRINKDYADKEVLFLIVLNGAFMFASDLLKQIEGNHRLSFIKLSSYQGLCSNEKVRELIGIDEDLKGRDIIIIEDIIDSGNTMECLRELIIAQEPSSLEICTLMFKPKAFKKDYRIKYVGKEISNEFIIGYGFDFDGYGRNIKDIYQLKD
ncbi:MAG: hypoxanthine phosphoribosyltransferase [Bacteroidales bacterium]|nr:hypoxanthine phosphoribosyltransferase [Bacteroidales bacterium]MDD4703046.1 hypoxanthine phosphoribosyltransferase [Bacteroidales bacterium]